VDHHKQLTVEHQDDSHTAPGDMDDHFAQQLDQTQAPSLAAHKDQPATATEATDRRSDL
jgi:hypothetical protein